jgi:manganese/zinc/iron transport system substrate-binding protein
MITRILSSVLVTMLVVFALPGCEKQAAESTATDAAGGGVSDGPYSIVCTVGMVTDAVRNIVGDRAGVTGLMGSGVDPHLYKPTRSDVERLLEADVIFYNGLLLEGKMTDSLIRAATAGKKVHAVTELLDESVPARTRGVRRALRPPRLDGPERLVAGDRGRARQPDRVRSRRYADVSPRTPRRTSRRSRRWTTTRWRCSASVPEPQRVLVTAHDAFNYFGRRFGYEVVGSRASRRSPRRACRTSSARRSARRAQHRRGLRRVDGFRAEHQRPRGRRRGPAVTPSSSAASSSATRWARRARYEGTYIGMIDHNVTTIARALGGEAPARGIRGSWGRVNTAMTTHATPIADAIGPRAGASRLAALPEHSPASPLSIHAMTVAYHRKPVLWDVDYDAPPNELIAIVGPNGAGKSTLIKACLGLVPAGVGARRVLGSAVPQGTIAHRVRPAARVRGLGLPVSALDVVCMGRYRPIGWCRPVTRKRHKRCCPGLPRSGRDEGDSRTGRSASSRAGSSSGCSWRARLRRKRTFTSWTSRSPAWTPRPSEPSSPCCAS